MQSLVWRWTAALVLGIGWAKAMTPAPAEPAPITRPAGTAAALPAGSAAPGGPLGLAGVWAAMAAPQ